MTNKTIGLIMAIWSIVWILGAVGHIKFSMDYDKRQMELDNHNQALEKRIKVYEKLADPKSVQFYVKELNKILDNMTKLIRVVESGEEIDAFFGKMESDIETVKDMVNNIYPIVDEFETEKESTEAYVVQNNLRMRMVQENIDELIEDTEDYDLKLIKKFDIIENDLRDIKDLLDDIENSKIGKKIWNQ